MFYLILTTSLHGPMSSFSSWKLDLILNEAVPLHASQAQRRSRGIAFPSRGSGARRGSVVSSTPLLLYPGEIDPVRIVQEAGWALVTGLDGSRKSCPTRVQTPNLLACSRLL